MKTSEHFALDEWLSEYPDHLTYDEVLAIMRNPENTWRCDDIFVWAVVEDCTLEQVADFIENTKSHFERVTE
jgi:hypothetical protein